MENLKTDFVRQKKEYEIEDKSLEKGWSDQNRKEEIRKKKTKK